MKKVLSVLLAIIIVFSFCACGNVSPDSGSSGNGSSSNGASNNSSSDYNKNKEPLNAQNFISRLKDSDGFVCGYWDYDPRAFYFEDSNDSEFLNVKIRNVENLVVDSYGKENFVIDSYDFAVADPYMLTVYNESEISIRGMMESYNYTHAYTDSDNRFIVFAENDTGNNIDIFGDDGFVCMTEDTLHSFIKGLKVLQEKYSSEELETLYFKTLDDNIKLITDCIEAAN